MRSQHVSTLAATWLYFKIADQSLVFFAASAKVPVSSVAFVLLALFSALVTPFLDMGSTTFTVNLIVMHLFLVIPVFLPPFRRFGNVETFSVYTFVFLLCLAYHISLLCFLIYSQFSLNPFALLSNLFFGFFANHAQSSIASDMIAASIASYLYFGRNTENWKMRSLLYGGSLILVGPAFTLPVWLAMERYLVADLENSGSGKGGKKTSRKRS